MKGEIKDELGKGKREEEKKIGPDTKRNND
jgi:hypothetical protein